MVLAVLLVGCGLSERIEEVSGPTMGSSYSVKYVSAQSAPAPDRVKAEVEAILAEVDRQMSTYRGNSDIERFNGLPANSCQAMPAPVLELVRVGESLSQASAGAFDLTVEPLLDLWGFGPQSRSVRVPSAEQVAQVRKLVGHQHLRIDGQQLCKDLAVQLDLNSIAAGYTVDRIARRLGELGIGSYLVEVTGELKARGRKADGSPWRVAIEAPRDDRQVAQRVLQLDGYGISTSGDYRNYFEENGKRYSHTLDPHTGAPVTHRLAAVTVADPSALQADGLSTLLMVLGPERGMAFAERAGIAAFFVTREGEGFVTHGTPAFERLFAAEE
ncbi:FAD:protein FMN transferase [Pseudomonas cavernicola]|uniref:FAD:protein FMN transferase n=1 Tax=Pseudomonas cavernicola TaxID=2320866 RepID=A0A418XPN4_9PSED|nr:FAD:protein FMN transferase [Pseudomonas cavernicola]RJG14397.1 FAD:protein FMN transferase [Pseudomonas cavernicola]